MRTSVCVLTTLFLGAACWGFLRLCLIKPPLRISHIGCMMAARVIRVAEPPLYENDTEQYDILVDSPLPAGMP